VSNISSTGRKATASLLLIAGVLLVADEIDGLLGRSSLQDILSIVAEIVFAMSLIAILTWITEIFWIRLTLALIVASQIVHASAVVLRFDKGVADWVDLFTASTGVVCNIAGGILGLRVRLFGSRATAYFAVGLFCFAVVALVEIGSIVAGAGSAQSTGFSGVSQWVGLILLWSQYLIARVGEIIGGAFLIAAGVGLFASSPRTGHYRATPPHG